MTDFMNYDQIVLDAQAGIASLNVFKKVFADAGDVDFMTYNMPLADVRCKRLVPEAVGGQNYWCDLTLEVEISAMDMTNRREAAKIRNDLVNAVQRYFQTNPHFSASVDTVIVGNVEFETGESSVEEGVFVASALCNFGIKLYSNG